MLAPQLTIQNHQARAVKARQKRSLSPIWELELLILLG